MARPSSRLATAPVNGSRFPRKDSLLSAGRRGRSENELGCNECMLLKAKAAASSQLKQPIIRSAFELLRSKLPKRIFYHTPEHSEDVLTEAMLFGLEDGLTERELLLLAIGAAYHDTGFVESASENEALGATLAVKAMVKTDEFGKSEQELVHSMILDTALHKTETGMCQVPTTVLSRYLCDADVSNLGRDDFFERGELYRRELEMPSLEFMRMTESFLACHQWHTPAAQRLRQAKRDANLEELRQRIAAHQG